MDRIPVRSSNIKAVGYDNTTLVLEIEFHDGGIYQYLDFSKSSYDDFVKAGSKGSYFHRHIKGKYRARKTK